MEVAISAFVAGIAAGSACTAAALTAAHSTGPPPTPTMKKGGGPPPPPPGNQPAKIRIYQKKKDLDLEKTLIADYDERLRTSPSTTVVVVVEPIAEETSPAPFMVGLDDIMRGKKSLKKINVPTQRTTFDPSPLQKCIETAIGRRRAVLV